MKQKHLVLVLVILGLVVSACGLPTFLAKAPTATPAPVKTLRPTFTPMPSATNTPSPTPSPVPTDTPPPTTTPLPATDTPEPPTPVLPTKTPEQPTPTPVPPTATQAPPTATRPRPTVTKAPPTPTPSPEAKHIVGAHGVSGLVTARDKTTFSVGEKAFFTYEALNHTKDAVGFEKLGIAASDGQFNTSWINPDVLQPGVPFKHDDGLTFNSPGTYKVWLSICFGRCDAADGDWEEFRQGAATITVK